MNRQPPRAWQVIAQEIRDLVRSGACPLGEKLPTKKELALRYGTSGATIQRAMDQLADEGLVEARRGLGWFASLPVPIALLRSSPHWRDRNAQVRPSVRHGWRHPYVKVTTQKMRADARVAEDLRIPVGAWVCRRERRVGNGGRVLHIGRSYLPEAITRNTILERSETLEQGTYDVLSRHGHSPRSITETVSVDVANEYEAKILALDIARHPMVVRIVRIVHGERGRLEADYLTARMGQLRLQYDLPVPLADPGPTTRP